MSGQGSVSDVPLASSPLAIDRDVAKLVGLEAAVAFSEIMEKEPAFASESKEGDLVYIPLTSTSFTLLSESKGRAAIKKLYESGLLLQPVMAGKRSRRYALNRNNLKWLKAMGAHYLQVLAEQDVEGLRGFRILAAQIDRSLCPRLSDADYGLLANQPVVVEEMRIPKDAKFTQNFTPPVAARVPDEQPPPAPPDDAPVEPPPNGGNREAARNDYVAYCKYMKAKETLAKNVDDWTATDFVIYLYCGIAKRQRTDLPFPDYAKDGAAMKRLITKHGKTKLKDLIYNLVMFRDEIAEQQWVKGLTVGIAALSTDWIVDKVWQFILARRQQEQESGVLKGFQEAEKRAHETVPPDSGMLGKLRDKYGKGNGHDGAGEGRGEDGLRDGRGGDSADGSAPAGGEGAGSAAGDAATPADDREEGAEA